MTPQALVVLLLPLLAAGQGTTSDAIAPWALFQESGGLAVKPCPGEGGTLRIGGIHFHSGALTLRVAGHLASEITGGNLSTKITLGEAPKGATRWQRSKRKMAWLLGRTRFGTPEGTAPLCSGRQRCPLAAGAQEMEFRLKSLPKLLLAGSYQMRLSVHDQATRPVFCVEGSLTVGHGQHGEVIRTLQEWPCNNTAWSADRSGDEQCQNEIVNPGQCESTEPSLMQHIERFCREACGWCEHHGEHHGEEHGEADGAGGSRFPWLHALGVLLAASLCWQ